MPDHFVVTLRFSNQSSSIESNKLFVDVFGRLDSMIGRCRAIPARDVFNDSVLANIAHNAVMDMFLSRLCGFE